MSSDTYQTFLTNPVDLAGSYHLIMAGKGGVGKSFVARMIAETILYGLKSGDIAPTIVPTTNNSQKEKGNLQFFDVDPVNHTFQSTLKEYAQRADIFISDDYSSIDDTRLDDYFLPSENPKDTRVFDIGSNQYQTLLNYFEQVSLADAFKEENRALIFHIPLCGYGYFRESLETIIQILYATENSKIVVWINDYLPMPRESKVSYTIQTFFENEENFFSSGSYQNQFSIDDLNTIIRNEDFMNFSEDQLHSVYDYIRRATNNFSYGIVLANPKRKGGYNSIRGAINDALTRNVLFSEAINDKSLKGDRYRLKNFFILGRDSLFNQTFTVFQKYFNDFAADSDFEPETNPES